MKLYNIILLTLLVCSVVLTSCGSDDEITPDQINVSNLTKITELELTELNATAEIYAGEELFVGYNNIYVALFDANKQLIKNADISFMPKMQMMDMSHAAPIVKPEAIDESIGLYKGALVFVMPSGTMGSWSLTFTINVDGTSSEKEFDVNVVEPTEARLKSFQTADETSYFVAIVNPAKPIVGINDCEIFVAKKENMMSYPAVTNLSLEIEPEMPTMGHGSPNNVNPSHTENGHYMGKINFTMTGLWRVNMKISEGSTMLKDDISFDITF